MLRWSWLENDRDPSCWVFASALKSWLLETARRLGLIGLRLQPQPVPVARRPQARIPNRRKPSGRR